MHRKRRSLVALAGSLGLALAISGSSHAAPAFPEQPEASLNQACAAVLATSQTGWQNMSPTGLANTLALFADACIEEGLPR